MDEPNPAHLEAYFAAELPSFGMPGTFGIVTAHNPGSAPASAESNEAADAELERALTAADLPHFRVTGRSRDGSHREPGYGIAAALDTIRALSRDFRQEAFFWVEDGQVFVINTEGARRHPVGAWKDRLL